MSPTHELPIYKYTALEQAYKDLRILVLESALLRNTEVKCRLETWRPKEDSKKLENNPELKSQPGPRPQHYDALSWSWPVSSKQDTQITITDENGKAKARRIPKDLHSALIHLRSPSTERRIWIDYLCIDQDNLDERNSQVPRMAEIYKGADTVCIWLGDQAEGSDLAIDFIQELEQNIFGFEATLDDNMIHKWKAMKIFMKRRWFQRRWVIQEVALAQQATVYCGDKQLKWGALTIAVSLIVDGIDTVDRLRQIAKAAGSVDNDRKFFDEILALGATALVRATGRIQEKIDNETALVSLPFLVGELAMFKNKEPRDAIYALLALARDVQPYTARIDNDKSALNSPIMSRLAESQKQKSHVRRYLVNYRQPVLDVYQQFIEYAIYANEDATRALDAILRPFAQEFTYDQDGINDQEHRTPQGFRNGPALPSWMCSDTKYRFKQIEIHDASGNSVYESVRQYGDPFTSRPGGINYNAAGTKRYSPSRIRFRKRKSHYSMYVEGFVLCAVTETLPSSQLGTIPVQWLNELHSQNLKDPDTLWRVLCANRAGSGPRPPYFKPIIERSIGRHTTDYDTQGSMLHKSRIISRTLTHVKDTVWGRSLIRTDSGFVGLAPADTQKNDLVCILYGCSVPVILRKFLKQSSELEDEEIADKAYFEGQEKEKSVVKVVDHFKQRWHRKHYKSKVNVFVRIVSTSLTHSIERCRLFRDNLRKASNRASLPRRMILSILGRIVNNLLLIMEVPSPRIRKILSAVRGIAVGDHSRATFRAFVFRILTFATVMVYARLQGQDLQLIRLLIVQVVPQVLIDTYHISARIMVSREQVRPWVLVQYAVTIMVAVALLVVVLDSGKELATGLLVLSSTLIFPELMPPSFLEAMEQLTKFMSLSVSVDEAQKELQKHTIQLKDKKKAMKLQWFEVIGECYIDKMMNGEAIQLQNDNSDKYRPTVMELR